MQNDNMPAPLRLVQIRGAEQNRQALLVHKLEDDLPQLPARKGIDADGWLVEKQEFRRANQRASQSEFLLHSARKPSGEATGERSQSRHVHQTRVNLAALIGSDAMQIGVKIQILLNVKIFIQPESLRHVSNARLNLLRIRGHINIQNLQLTGIGSH